ncbi:MAG: DUF2783 domain-containing protein [Betaproteobacteria bacterium]|jgi:Protein of unknown function (DUF2783)|nr:DUF2783 domain-containing protein [Betaproteobacteria bacterium]NBP44510.1 DUF2783 domain-containing protein [Betaproteobacteria bacterium]
MPSLELDPHFHSREPALYGPFSAGDAFYEALMKAHQGLSHEQSDLFNAKLILLLANHVGDVQVLEQAIALAREDL